MAIRIDKELDEFRRIMDVPSTFDEGFRWSALLGAIFVALLMVPGAIYMGLLAGVGIGGAAQWVTVILFIEVARRAHKHLNKSEIFVLFFMAGSMMGGLGLAGGRTSGLLWDQFFVQSDAAAANGIANEIPRWVAPNPVEHPESYGVRSFFHVDWAPVLVLAVVGTFLSQLCNTVVGYGLFRITSDIEKLPFPLAPVGAQGIMAMAEDIEAKTAKSAEENWRWRVSPSAARSDWRSGPYTCCCRCSRVPSPGPPSRSSRSRSPTSPARPAATCPRSRPASTGTSAT